MHLSSCTSSADVDSLGYIEGCVEEGLEYLESDSPSHCQRRPGFWIFGITYVVVMDSPGRLSESLPSDPVVMQNFAQPSSATVHPESRLRIFLVCLEVYDELGLSFWIRLLSSTPAASPTEAQVVDSTRSSENDPDFVTRFTALRARLGEEDIRGLGYLKQAFQLLEALVGDLDLRSINMAAKQFDKSLQHSLGKPYGPQWWSLARIFVLGRISLFIGQHVEISSPNGTSDKLCGIMSCILLSEEWDSVTIIIHPRGRGPVGRNIDLRSVGDTTEIVAKRKGRVGLILEP